MLERIRPAHAEAGPCGLPTLAIACETGDAGDVVSTSRDSTLASVLTVTLNPTVDVSTSVDQLVPDHKLRAPGWDREAGGGGVNVSRVLQRLGVPPKSFVVVGGATGVELVALMRAEGLDVTEFAGRSTTRESFAITESRTDRQFRISVPGPTLEDAGELERCVIEAAAGCGVVVLSGSIPPGAPSDILVRIIAGLEPGTTTIVDTAGPALAEVAAHHATVVKPSQRELATLVGWQPHTSDQIEQAAREALERGNVEAVVASCGPTGALLSVRNEAPIWFRPPPVRPVSTIGAGDSMVAGIAASLARGTDVADAVRAGVAAGTAAVLTPGTQLCDPGDATRFFDRVSVHQ